MKKQTKKILYTILPMLAITALFVFAGEALAQFTPPTPGGVGSTATGVGNILLTVDRLIDVATPILIGATILVIAFGGLKAIAAKDGPDREGAIKIVTTGIIFLLLFVSIWGIIQILARTFNVGSGGSGNPLIPEVCTPVPGTNQCV